MPRHDHAPHSFESWCQITSVERLAGNTALIGVKQYPASPGAEVHLLRVEGQIDDVFSGTRATVDLHSGTWPRAVHLDGQDLSVKNPWR